MDKKEKQAKEIADEYLSSLVDLNINSKPLINMLTILAEENIEHGQVIVDAVEQHIAKVFIYFILNNLYQFFMESYMLSEQKYIIFDPYPFLPPWKLCAEINCWKQIFKNRAV